MSTVKSSQFAVAVFLEFIVFILVTYYAVEHQGYLFFDGFNFLLLIHVFTHLAQSIYLFYRMIIEELVSLKEIFLYASSGLLLIPLVMIGHKLGKIIIRD